MIIPELASDLGALEPLLRGTAWVAPTLVKARWAQTTVWMLDPHAVAAELQAFGPAADGWVETTDVALPWRTGQGWPTGTVLNAELASGARSLHVRQVDGRWACTTLHDLGPQAAPPPGADVTEGWQVERQQLQSDPIAPAWRYAVLLQALPDGELRELACRLLPLHENGAS